MSISSQDIVDVDTIEVRELIAKLWSGRRWVLGGIILFAGLFVTLAFVMTPVYRASVVLVSAGNSRSGLNGALSSMLGSLGGIASLAGVNIGSDSGEVEEALAVLRSRQFTESFITEKQLMPVLFSKLWDAQSSNWRLGEKAPTLAQAYKYFDKDIRSIIQDKKTGLITVQIEWKDRMQAAEWANDLIEKLNAEMRTRALVKADASVHYLEAELNDTALIGTREAINRLIEAQINQRMVANVTQEYAFRVVDRAMAPDKEDPAKPNKLMLFAIGPFLGALVGGMIALFPKRSPSVRAPGNAE